MGKSRDFLGSPESHFWIFGWETGFVPLFWELAKMNAIWRPKQIFIYLAMVFASLTACPSQGQGLLLEDKPALDSMRKAIDFMYNFQFEKAQHSLSRFQARYINHPGFMLFNSVTNFWKHFPIGSKPKEYEAYKKNLHALIQKGEDLENKFPKSPEPGFYIMMANLILARHHSEEGEYIKAVSETRRAYAYIKKGFELKSQFPEFFFSTGLYNYYRVAFPESHPLYSPFTMFFPGGDKAVGLKDLETASLKSLFSRPEALVFLTSIYLRDEFNVGAALKYSQLLHKHYPGNWLFSILHAECLLEAGQIEAAEPLITRLLSRNESGALLAGYYLKGLFDRKKGNTDAAKWAWQKALQYGKTKDRLSKGFIGLSYSEMAKIARDEGNLDWAKKYYKLALENCSYKKVKRDAESAGF